MKSERKILELIVKDIRLPENVRRNAARKLEEMEQNGLV